MTIAQIKTPIVYPEPDGEPIAESDATRDYLFYGVEALKLDFFRRSDVYVSGNLWVSYLEGVPEAAVWVWSKVVDSHLLPITVGAKHSGYK